MRKLYSTCIKVIFALMAFVVADARAQTTVSTPVPSSTVYYSDTDPGVVVFGVKNNNAFDIVVTDLSSYVQAGAPAYGDGTYTLWYHTTAVTGAPTQVTVANGWIAAAPSATLTVTSTGVRPILSGLNITIPAGATYRFALQAPIRGPYYGTSGSTGDIVSNGGVDLYMQANALSPTYAGAFNAVPGNTPRSFYGSITFSPAGACNTTVDAGQTVSLSSRGTNFVCQGGAVSLALTGNTIGTGLTYQWQSSSDNSFWTDIGTPTPSPLLTTTQTSSTYYRAIATCGAGSDISTPVQMVTYAPLSGAYTIDKTVAASATNFTSFTSAVKAMECAGISGPVTFTVTSGTGPYAEQLTIPSITGASATNRIRFLGNGETIRATPVTGRRHIIRLDGADYVTLDSLNITSLATDFGWGIHFTNGANYDSVRACVIDLTSITSTTQSNSAGITMSGSVTSVTTAGNFNNNVIAGNTIKGGYQGIIIAGATGALNASNNKITNNIIQDFYATGVELADNDGGTVSYNDIHRTNRSWGASATTIVGTFTGVRMSGDTKNSRIDGNRVHDTHTGSLTDQGDDAYGIANVSNDAAVGSENLVTNNLLYNFNSATGIQYGLYNSASDGVFYYHNTVVLAHAASTAGTTRGFYQVTAATGLQLKNNIIYINRGGSGTKYALYFGTTTSAIISNNNVLFNASPAGTNGIGYYSTGQATLAAWQAVNGSAYDQQSISVDPLFTGGGDYTPTEPSLNGIGANVGVTTDILGAPRVVASPDPGAYEFTIAGLDADITWVSPVMPVTPGLHTITVRITNNQTTPINTVNLSYTDGNTVETQTFSGLNIAAGANQQLSFTTQYNLSYSIRLRAYINIVNGTTDNSQANDTTAYQNLCMPLSGDYTINSGLPNSATNFQTFTEAAYILGCSGVSGPVRLNVESSGFFAEQFTIPAISGVSATNTVRFLGNGATIQFAPTLANRYIVKLDGADYVTLDSLNIISTSADYGIGIQLANGADNDSIISCTIDATSVTSTNADYSGGIVSSSSITDAQGAGNASNLVIINNLIKGGYQGIILNGATGAVDAVNNKITGNVIQDFYSIGIELADTDGALVTYNDINRMTRAGAVGTFEGIELNTGTKNSLIEGNRIHDTHNSAGSDQDDASYGIFSSSNDAAVGAENRIINNIIYNFNSGTGIQYGLYNTGSNGVFYYHNTVVLDNSGSTEGITRGFYQTTVATGIVFRNNIVYIARGGTDPKYALYFNTPTSAITSNNNVLYNVSSGGTVAIGYHNALTYADLAAWKTANSGAYDQQSISEDPVFVGGGDFTPSNPTLNGVGGNVGVTIDIIGTARTASPDPGAYEFTVSGLDADINWVSPTMPVTAGMKTITVNITNTQTSTINSINLSYTDGTVVQTQTFSGLGLVSGASQQLSFTTQYNLSQSVVMRAYINTVNGVPDNNQVNDTTASQTFCVLMSGYYTINQAWPTGGGNFASMTAAVNQLVCSGVSGPVVIEVIAGSGPYVEQVTIPAINGASAVNNIRFLGNGETIRFASVTANRHIIKLDGTAHITIDSFHITSTSADYGWGIHLLNGAHHDSIVSSTIDMMAVDVDIDDAAGIVISNSSSDLNAAGNASNNTFFANTIRGGYYGIIINGTATTAADAVGNRIIGNTIQDFYSIGIELADADGTVISQNDIHRQNRSAGATATTIVGTFEGIELNGATKNTLIERNRIHDTHTSAGTDMDDAAYGIFSSANDAAVGSENKIINNLVYNFNSNTGIQYGLYNSGSNGVFYYHNTVALDHDASSEGNTRALYQTTAATGIQVRNNVLVVTRAGTGTKHALYFGTTTSTITSNNNVLYVNAPGTTVGVGSYGTANSGTLANWKTVNGNVYDQQSVSANPLFQNPGMGDFTPTASAVDNVGAPIGVTADIIDVARSASNPDAGAYEFTAITAGVNMRAEMLVTPEVRSSGCYTASETVTIRIKNTSTSAIDFAVNPVTINVSVTGAATQNLSHTLTSGSLASEATMDVVIPATLNMTNSGIYTFNASTAVAGDANTSNDAMPTVTRTKNALTAGAATGSSSFCAPSAINPVLTTTGHNGYSSLQWLQSTAAVGGYSPIGGATTATYNVTTSPTQTMYYKLLATCGTAEDSSAAVTVNYNNPQVTGTTGGARCGTGTVILGATASAGTTLNWYTASAGGAPIGTGTTFTTPVISATTPYYVAASGGGSTVSIGRNAPSDATSLSAAPRGLIFNANQPFVLNSVTVYSTAATAGSGTVEVRTSAGTTIAGPVTINWTGGGTAAAPMPVTIPLNLSIPQGTAHRLFMTTITGGGISYETGITSGTWSAYKTPGNEVEITSSITSFTGAPSLTTYYYFYNWQVTNGCESGRTAVAATVTQPNAAAGASGTTECGSATVSGTTMINYTDCDPIATITPSGAAPVSGSVNACVTIDATVQTAPGGEAYVQRHFDITPAVNPATATSTLVLYFLQSEFNAFNTANGTMPDLPTGAGDAAGIANLRITQYNGTGTTPGTYTGTATQINPADASIVYNATAGRWEITLDVTGSGGFYVHTGQWVLPVTLVNFRGEQKASLNRLLWTTSTETNNKGFELERSADGRTFSSIGFIATKAENGNSASAINYSFDDVKPIAGNNYYRLKQVDKDGKFSYSNTVLLSRKVTEITLSRVYPNPARTELNLQITAPSAGQVTILVTDLSGKVVIQQAATLRAGDNQQQLNVQHLAQGTYIIRAVCANGCETAVHKFVKQ